MSDDISNLGQDQASTGRVSDTEHPARFPAPGREAAEVASEPRSHAGSDGTTQATLPGRAAIGDMLRRMGDVVDLLSRPVYGLGQVDRILGLRGGTARRWIDGYRRGAKQYPPVVRERPTGEETVTWGEFVETRLLAQYRDAGVPLVRMRPAVDALREELQTPYPLASARTWLDVRGRELVRQVQEQVKLERALSLVVVRTGQRVLDWAPPAEGFRQSVEWTDGEDAQPRLLRPAADLQDVAIDPLRGFGEPVVRNVRTEVIGELFRAGESADSMAELYALPRPTVDQALRYEFRRATTIASDAA